MENCNKIVPPHLNAEVYRTDTTGTCTVSYLDYIHIHKDSTVLVGSSELTGRYWNGGANIYKNTLEAQQQRNKINKSIYLTTGNTDGCFIGDTNKVFLCEDSGTISIWSKIQNDQNIWHQWKLEVSVAEHDDAVMAMDCLDPYLEYVTVGADGNAKLWDMNETICIRDYQAAHSRAIYGVDVRPASKTNFATCSLDEYVTHWDENIDKPVSDIFKNDCCVRCLQWIDENKLIFGDEAGILRLIDVRNCKSVVKLTEFPAAVHKIDVHPSGEKVAVCCDNKIVSICDLSGRNSNMIYHDRHMHSNFVRDVAWDPHEQNTLYSLGWDGEIKSHRIT